MLKKDAVLKIFESVSKKIESAGFKTDVKKQWFIKDTPDALFLYDIHFYDRTNTKSEDRGFLVEPFVWVNVKPIEEYYKEITVNTELRKDTDLKTLGESVAEITANPNGIHKKWNESLNLYVFNEKDANNVAKQLLKQFEKFALPYFNKYANVRMVDELLNKHPREYCVHMTNDLFRMIKGVIAAKLNGNSKLQELVSTYKELMLERDMPPDCKEEMSRLEGVLPMIGNSIILPN